MSLVSHLPALGLLSEAGLYDPTGATWHIDEYNAVHIPQCSEYHSSYETISFTQVVTNINLKTCWLCAGNILDPNSVTSAQNNQAHKTAVLGTSMGWLLTRMPDLYNTLALELSNDLTMWLRNLDNIGHHPHLDAVHYEQLEKLLEFKNTHQKTLNHSSFELDGLDALGTRFFSDPRPVEDLEKLAHQKAWVSLGTTSYIPSEFLARVALPDLRESKSGDSFIVQTTLMVAYEHDIVGPEVLLVGDQFTIEDVQLLCKLTEHNPLWSLEARIAFATAAKASCI